MKKNYVAPTAEIVFFSLENIITSSGNGDQYNSIKGKVSGANNILSVDFNKWGEVIEFTY